MLFLMHHLLDCRNQVEVCVQPQWAKLGSILRGCALSQRARKYINPKCQYILGSAILGPSGAYRTLSVRSCWQTPTQSCWRLTKRTHSTALSAQKEHSSVLCSCERVLPISTTHDAMSLWRPHQPARGRCATGNTSNPVEMRFTSRRPMGVADLCASASPRRNSRHRFAGVRA